MESVVGLWDAVAQGTVFVPITAIDDFLGTLPLPASIDVVKFLLTLILALPLGFVSRYVPIGAPRHVYNLLFGIIFAQGCYGPQWLHMSFSAAVSYVLMVIAPRKQSAMLVFTWMMLYIGGSHIFRMYTDWLGWKMDFTGPQMMATIKITSAAFNYSDGKVNRTEKQRQAEVQAMDKQISDLTDKNKTLKDDKEVKENKKTIAELRTTKGQTELALDELPSPLEYFAWVQNFSTYQAGPPIEIQEYLNVNNGLLTLPGGCVGACLRQFVLGVVCLVGHLALDGAFSLGSAAEGLQNKAGPLSDSFLDMDIVTRIGYSIICIFGVQCRYFMAWKFGEAAATAFGYGSKNGKWNGCQNIDLKEWVLADNMSVSSKAWNQKTQVWLQTYTYRRFPGSRGTKLLATYAVSAYWHGFYPGYFITFFNLGLLSIGQDNMKAHIRPYFCKTPTDEKAQNVFQSESPLKKLYDIIGILSVHWVKSFATMPFLLSTLGNATACASRSARDCASSVATLVSLVNVCWLNAHSMHATARLYLLGVFFTMGGVFLVPMVPKKKAAKKD